MTKKTLNKTERISVYGIFSAIIIILAFLPIRTLGFEITLAMVPIAVGAICFGEYAGLVLGTVFGLVSFLQAVTGYSGLGEALFSVNPFYTFLMCVPTRMLVGYISGLVYKLFKKTIPKVSEVAVSLICPLLNTVFFMGVLVACFYNAPKIIEYREQLGAVNPINFIILFVGINGLVELICGFVLAAPASLALSRYFKLKD